MVPDPSQLQAHITAQVTASQNFLEALLLLTKAETFPDSRVNLLSTMVYNALAEQRVILRIEPAGENPEAVWADSISTEHETLPIIVVTAEFSNQISAKRVDVLHQIYQINLQIAAFLSGLPTPKLTPAEIQKQSGRFYRTYFNRYLEEKPSPEERAIMRNF